MNRLDTKVLIILNCISLFGCGTEDNGNPISDTGSGSGSNTSEYRLIFAEEFDQDGTINDEYWTPETGYSTNGWGNDEWQQYTATQTNVRIENGSLRIEAHCPTAPNCAKRDDSVTSARVITMDKFEFKYGKIEARIKPPVGKGAWPAFWMLGANFPEVGWPQSGEIDIMEMHNKFSNENTTHFTLHWCNDLLSDPCQYDPGWTFVSDNREFSGSLGNDFHVFEAVWGETSITGKIDGITYYRRAINPTSMLEFRREFFIILNVAIGGTLGGSPDASTIWPQVMEVDYVRVYQQEGDDGTASFGENAGNSSTGGNSVNGLIDFELTEQSYIFKEGGGFAGGISAVVSNPDISSENSSGIVVRMLKFPGEVYGGSTLELSSQMEILPNHVFTMKVWSQRSVDVLLKMEGGPTGERTVGHGGSGWEELSFDFSGVNGASTNAITLIFDNGTMGDAANNPLEWTFYYDDIDLR
ncbi:MAG: beta-glucanase (GH16 family) [Gammaproteobacteria bacterium]|jgi:beta-glucanase (GH16 family)